MKSCFFIRGLLLSVFVFAKAIVFSIADYNVIIAWNAHDVACRKNCIGNFVVLSAWRRITMSMVMGNYDMVRIKD